MKPVEIDPSNASALESIPASCGAVTVECTDVAGIVAGVISSSESLRSEHDMLLGTVAALEADQEKVSQASDEARLLSERALTRLSEGSALIQSSLAQINSVLELVDTLGQHVTSFSAAMEQVRRSAQDIDDIAETTNILALNATIEAMRAGDAGRTFAVVASEVKSLANETRRATEEIAITVDTLGSEASEVIGRIEAGSQASGAAKASVSQIEATMGTVGELVSEVDKQNEVIARSTGTISGHVNAVQEVLASFDKAALANEARLQDAHHRMANLELTASEMFDSIVKAGLSPEDSMMVERAQRITAQLAQVTETALSDGTISEPAVFDDSYEQVANTNPPLFRTNLSDWADVHWRPIFEATGAGDDRVIASACTDMQGFIPTQISAYSREPTGDLAHDTKYCRNGRIILEAIDKRAKESRAPYMMAVYRQEGDGERYVVVRNIYVPLFIQGRRWGDFELAYSFD